MKDFEKLVLENYQTEVVYRNYIWDYYTIFIGEIVTAAISDNLPFEISKEQMLGLYECAFDKMIASEPQSFNDMNRLLLHYLEQATLDRYGDHSEEYEIAREYCSYISLIFERIENLDLPGRTAFRIAFIYVKHTALRRQFIRCSSELMLAIGFIGLSLKESKAREAGCLFEYIVEFLRDQIQEIEKNTKSKKWNLKQCCLTIIERIRSI